MTTAIIHHNQFSSEADHYTAIAVAYGECLLHTRCVPSGPDSSSLSEEIAEAFALLNQHHTDGPLYVYVSQPFVAAVLAQCDLPNVFVRPVVSGAAFQRSWEVASRGCAQAAEQFLADLPPPPPLEIATDASKNNSRHRPLSGIGVATSTGQVWFDTVHATNVLEAECAAIARAIRSHGSPRGLIIRTDSQKAAAILRGSKRGYGGEWEKSAQAELQRVRELGWEVEVQWVKGHNGDILNEIADRAARCGRRIAEWSLDPSVAQKYRSRLKAELAASLAMSEIEPYEAVS